PVRTFDIHDTGRVFCRSGEKTHRNRQSRQKEELFHESGFLFREPPNTEGDRQPDREHVDADTQKQVVKFIRTLRVKRGEWENDWRHYLIDNRAIDQSAD